MSAGNVDRGRTAFGALTPDAVIGAVEKALGERCSNRFYPLNSYINRVYELELEGGSEAVPPTTGLHGRERRDGLIAKFYRPGRWSREALADEHAFVLALAEAEVPVIPPLPLKSGSTLASHEGISFAVYPKKSGRVVDEFTPGQWQELGRLLGRVHAVGATLRPRDRVTMAPDRSTRSQVEYLLASGFIPPDLKDEFANLTGSLIEKTAPLFRDVEMIPIHGDCHISNIIHRPGESFYIIDFDDMAVGPPVQDLWMLLPGYRGESIREIGLFLEGYETFHRFDRGSLRLIGPLRAMRFIHYQAWCARQAAEDGESRAIPDFGTRGYWLRELTDLSTQMDRIRLSGGMGDTTPAR